MKRYRLLTSSHVGEDGTNYKKGDTIKTSLELDKLFVNKFEVVGKGEPEPEPEAEKTDEGNGGENTPEGEDVTEKFESAVEAELKVHKVGKLYVVTDPSDADAGKLNEDDLTSIPKVNAFIESWINS